MAVGLKVGTKYSYGYVYISTTPGPVAVFPMEVCENPNTRYSIGPILVTSSAKPCISFKYPRYVMLLVSKVYAMTTAIGGLRPTFRKG